MPHGLVGVSNFDRIIAIVANIDETMNRLTRFDSLIDKIILHQLSQKILVCGASSQHIANRDTWAKDQPDGCRTNVSIFIGTVKLQRRQ